MPLRRTILLLSFTGIFLAGHTQVEKVRNLPTFDYKLLRFGFTVGLNTMDFAIKRTGDSELFADVSRTTPGFQVSIVSELRLSEYWGLRFLPGITFGQRELSFYRYNEQENKTERIRVPMNIESNYIDLPLILKFKSERVNNYRPFVIAGLTPRYDMAARGDYDPDSEIYVRLKRMDLACEFGVGLDQYLQYFKYTTELKISVGLRDMLVHEPSLEEPDFVNAIDRLNAYVLMLCFHFE